MPNVKIKDHKPLSSRSHIKEILFALSDAGIRYVVAGGVAAVLYGVERVTMDVDIAVDMEELNLRRFLTVVEKLNLVPRAPVSATILLDPESRIMMIEQKNALVFTFIDLSNPFRQVDVFLSRENKYAILVDGCSKLSMEGRSIQVVSKEKLITMKKSVIPMRSKDKMDVAELENLL